MTEVEIFGTFAFWGFAIFTLGLVFRAGKEVVGKPAEHDRGPVYIRGGGDSGLGIFLNIIGVILGLIAFL